MSSSSELYTGGASSGSGTSGGGASNDNEFGSSGDDKLAEDAFGAPIGPLPSVSSKINYKGNSVENIVYDLWYVSRSSHRSTMTMYAYST
jgi:hypothetical protein